MSSHRAWAGAIAVGSLALPAPALACGGFFCNAAQPVDQAAEEIVFAADAAAGTVTMHVKIEYAGPSSSFAWVVPVPEVPELALGTNALFPVLSGLRAQWLLQRDFGACAVPMAAPSSSDAGGGGGGGVDVISTGVVGPYETVVLRASEPAELLDWLQVNGYDLPDRLDEALAPYVADGQYFVALRLSKDKDTGDLQPLAVTWHGQGIAVPIQLTSIAATEDMGLRVYVLGEHRAVPASYLHLVLNEMAIDWWTGGANIADVIARAADEGGGHGFFTDYAGPTAPVLGQVYVPAWNDLATRVAAQPDAAGAVTVLLDSGLPLDDDLLSVLSDALGLSEQSGPGFDLVDLVGCLQPSYSYYYGSVDPASCYPEQLAAIELDAPALAADLEEFVLGPRRAAEALLGSAPKITRLTSSVSPVEMTVDPTFVLNPDMPDVALAHQATESYACGMFGASDLFAAERELTLSDGRSVSLPSLEELDDLGLTSIEWLEQQGLTEPVNARVEQTGPSGPPVVLRDNHDLLWSQLEALSAGRCGCASPGAAGTSALGLGAAILALRRRRR